MSVDVYVGIGGNLGNVAANFDAAFAKIAVLPGVDGLQISPNYLTKPVSPIPQPDFLNAVCHFGYRGTPFTLLRELQRIQLELGQLPKRREEPRKIDLDLLFFGNAILEGVDLELPHPRWRERLFVLTPLADLTEWVWVGSQKINVWELLALQQRNACSSQYPLRTFSASI